MMTAGIKGWNKVLVGRLRVTTRKSYTRFHEVRYGFASNEVEFRQVGLVEA